MPKPLERMVTIPLGDQGAVLEGTFLAGDPEDGRGAVVAPPHPLFGGSMDSPVVNELAHAFARHGIASLSFNWRGVGASAGVPSGDPGAAAEDYRASTEHLEKTVEGPLIAAGYSFGSVAALHAAERHRRVRRLVLVSPPVQMLGVDGLGEFDHEMLVITGEADDYSPPDALRPMCEQSQRIHLHVIAEADHFYVRGLAEISRAVSGWI